MGGSAQFYQVPAYVIYKIDGATNIEPLVKIVDRIYQERFIDPFFLKPYYALLGEDVDKVITQHLLQLFIKNNILGGFIGIYQGNIPHIVGKIQRSEYRNERCDAGASGNKYSGTFILYGVKHILYNEGATGIDFLQLISHAISFRVDFYSELQIIPFIN